MNPWDFPACHVWLLGRWVNGGWMAWQNGILPLRFRTPRCSMGGGAPSDVYPKFWWYFLGETFYQMAKCRVPKHDQMAKSRKDANVDNCGFGSDFFPGSGGFMPPSLTMFFCCLYRLVPSTFVGYQDTPSTHKKSKLRRSKCPYVPIHR